MTITEQEVIERVAGVFYDAEPMDRPKEWTYANQSKGTRSLYKARMTAALASLRPGDRLPGWLVVAQACPHLTETK